MNSQDFHNWCKLQSLLNIRASELLKSLFKTLWQARFNKEWSSSSGQDLINIIKPKSFKSYFKSQRNLLQTGDIDNWDLQLLKNLFIDSDICGSGKQGDDYRKNAEKLAEIRNKLEHSASKNVSDTDFGVYWERISKILVGMGGSKDELDDLKGSLKLQKMIILISQNIKKANEIKLEGNKQFQEKKYAEAISSYTEAIALPDIPDQDLAILYSNRSASYLERHLSEKISSDDIRNALKDAKRSKELNPEWFKPYLQLGKVYLQKNKLGKAIKAYDKASHLEPNNEEVKIAQADARKAKGNQNRYQHLDPGLHGVTEEQLSQEFEMRTGKTRNPKDSDEIRKSLEKQNPAGKDCWEGHDYRDGTGGKKKDLAKAIECYHRAIDQGNAEAMYNLATLTDRGKGVEKDYALAFSLFTTAAEQPPFDLFVKGPTVGVAEAQHALGLYYLEGLHVAKDELMAIYWFERAVENGYGRSANNLGLMYLDGQGVTQDLKRAEQYLLFAFSHKDHNAASNLVSLYLELGDPEKAIKWNKIAIEKGSLRAIAKQKELEDVCSYLKKELEMDDVEEWEKANNLSPDSLAPGERHQRKLKSKFGDKISAFIENFKRYHAEILIPPKFRAQSSQASRYDWIELGRYSEVSHTARIMFEAMSYFNVSFSYLFDISEDVRFDNEFCHEFIFNLAECLRLEQIVINFPLLHMIELAKKIAEMIFSHIHSLGKRKELDEKLLHLDQDARFCFAWLSLESPDAVIEFLSESIRKYPKNADFLRVRGNAYGFKYQYEDALRDANRGLEIEPENYEFLYLKAVSLRVLGHSNAIQAYEEFLSKAPVDHRKVPEAYYAMGACLLVPKNLSKIEKTLKIMKEYYEQGEDMEKKQLPCFLPYKSPSKKVLEPFVNPLKLMEEVKPPSSTQKEKLKDPLRKQLIILHRRTVKNWRSNLKVGQSNTFKPPKEQKLPQSLIGLKQTYLNEIDFTKDHILTGYVLELTVIDIANQTGMSIQFVAEDKNEHVQRVALYNFDESEIEVKELGIGSKFSIINPYIRMAVDLKPIIRVDDPSTVMFGEKVKNMCACCGDVSRDLLVCGACKTTAYCSKECQIVDWKKFEHKFICVKRKTKDHPEAKNPKKSDHQPRSEENRTQYPKKCKAKTSNEPVRVKDNNLSFDELSVLILFVFLVMKFI